MNLPEIWMAPTECSSTTIRQGRVEITGGWSASPFQGQHNWGFLIAVLQIEVHAVMCKREFLQDYIVLSHTKNQVHP